MRRLSLLFLPLVFLSGCSVMMAASSQQEPNQSSLQLGAHRSEVEMELGRPIRFIRDGGGARATYQFFSSDDKSYGRAITYAVLDGLTLGVAELVTAPMEALQGKRHVVEIRYDRHGRVLDVQETVHEAPMEKPETILNIEKAPKET